MIKGEPLGGWKPGRAAQIGFGGAVGSAKGVILLPMHRHKFASPSVEQGEAFHPSADSTESVEW
jgi:hypothetical protein